MKEYSGSRWYKCDLHLHTMTSPCYLDKENTPAQWVARAKEQGLSVVAVTDHNDYRGIKDITEEGKKQGIAVFPGVEITCDSTKIHMLILFDTCKDENTVRDFLSRCDIDSECVGESGGTELSVMEICQIARKRGALVIAAHIDEFSSISSMNQANLEKLLTSGLLDAVQVANVPTWEKYQRDKDAESMYAAMKESYGEDATPEEVEKWRKCYMRAKELGLPMISFSDNPAGPDTGKHGLWGIGNVYTWIQMDDVINLESIRQSLISPTNRIRMSFDSKEEPKAEPDFWIRSLEVRNSLLNPHLPIHLDFHPQLNCIIGGRGSGKSSIVRILKGVYQQMSGFGVGEKNPAEHSFYVKDDGSGQGVFTEDSEVEIRFAWFGTEYRLVVSDILDMEHQKYSFYKINLETGEEEEEAWEDLRFLAMMSAQVFNKREINGLSLSSGDLLRYIDTLMNDMYILQARKEYYLHQLILCAQKIKSEKQLIGDSVRVNPELQWFSQLKADEAIPVVFRDNFDAMISVRGQAADMVSEGIDRMTQIREEQQIILGKYEDTLAEIRRMRTDYICYVLRNDENYKIELKPMADKESLHQMLMAFLGIDVSLIKEDVRRLEEALFAKKDGLKKYEELILKIRNKALGKNNAEPVECSDYFMHLIGNLSEGDFEFVHLFHPEDQLCIFYHPTGVKRFFPLENASSGEKATAMFSFFLQSKIVPLVVDQPETDMDNHFIYSEILEKLKKTKLNRQLIFTTHNPILTTNSDAGMITVMDAASKFVRVKAQGAIDNDDIRREICDTLEGSEAAFLQRSRKYNIKN